MISAASMYISCSLLCVYVSSLICDFRGAFSSFSCISLHFIIVFVFCNVSEGAIVRESRLLLFTHFICPESTFAPALQFCCLGVSDSVVVVCLMLLCVVDFYASACFFLLYTIYILLFCFLFGCICRFGGVLFGPWCTCTIFI